MSPKPAVVHNAPQRVAAATAVAKGKDEDDEIMDIDDLENFEDIIAQVEYCIEYLQNTA
jgi:hypothetical protein